jgi:class I fructose-bisphosphate aldolase
MTTLGKRVHLARLQNPASGRILTIAIDHAASYGVMRGLENIQAIVHRVAEGEPDAIMLMKGPARQCFEPYAGRIAFVLKSSTVSPYHPGHDVWVSPVADALCLGADAIAMALTVGSVQQPQLLANLAALVREAEQVAMPVIVHAYPNGELIPQDEWFSVERVTYAARMAMEVGVDIVKTFYTGSAETFAQVVDTAAPALVVAAGGPRLETDVDVLHMAYNVMQAGAAGITFGRNVWQTEDPAGMIRALRQIVHHNATVDDVIDRLE